MQVKWLKRALQNLQEESEYIASDSPRAAAKVAAKIESAVALLADNPAMGRPGRIPGTRELVVPSTPYIIPYRVQGNLIVVLRVFHARRRWPSSV